MQERTIDQKLSSRFHAVEWLAEIIGEKMNDQYWSWILTIVGLAGFILAGKKVWWCWYVNIACQALWFAYAVITDQYGFIVASLAYAFVFTKNAVSWTKEHRDKE